MKDGQWSVAQPRTAGYALRTSLVMRLRGSQLSMLAFLVALSSPSHSQSQQQPTDDAIYQAAEYISKSGSPNSRKVIIIITDNESNQPAGMLHSES